MSAAPLTGGELNAAITSALVGIHNRHLGRGPKSASTFYRENVVVTLMRQVLTPGERTLLEGQHTQTLRSIRSRLQELMEGEYRTAVEQLTGRKVTAFIGGNSADADMASEVFILDSPL